MSNAHQERPGYGVAYWEPHEKRSTENSPDWKGFVILKHDYKAGEKLKLGLWKKPTRIGFDLLSIKEDSYAKDKEAQGYAPPAPRPDREVDIEYKAKPSGNPRKPKDWDSDVPF